MTAARAVSSWSQHSLNTMATPRNSLNSDGDAIACSPTKAASRAHMRLRSAFWRGAAFSRRCTRNGWRWGSSLPIWRKEEGLKEPAETQKNDRFYTYWLIRWEILWIIIRIHSNLFTPWLTPWLKSFISTAFSEFFLLFDFRIFDISSNILLILSTKAFKSFWTP